MVRRIRCLPSVHDRSSASPSVGVSALSSSEFMNPHVVVAAGRARDGVPTLSGIKRRAKEVLIHFVLQPDDEAGLASCGNLHFAGGREAGI